MRVSHEGTNPVKYNVIEYADRGKFDRQRKSQAHRITDQASPVPELSFLPAPHRFSPYVGREERRVQGLD